MKFTILFDNYNYDKNLQSLWGFSCLIDTPDKTILFDTGSNGRILLKNAKKLGIDFKNIDIVFISHNHWDHIGGLDTIIEENPNITLILPSTLSKHLLKDLKTLVKKVMIIDSYTQLDTNLYSTGMIGDTIPEQSLIIEYKNKIFLITGCSHGGIDNIANSVNKPLDYIIGGFHLMSKSKEEIDTIINNFHSKAITPTHCTGDLAIDMLKQKYKDRFIKGGVGAVIDALQI